MVLQFLSSCDRGPKDKPSLDRDTPEQPLVTGREILLWLCDHNDYPFGGVLIFCLFDSVVFVWAGLRRCFDVGLF